MLNLFRKKSKVETLQKKYEKLMKESYEVSKFDRIKGDLKYAEAMAVLKEIESLQN